MGQTRREKRRKEIKADLLDQLVRNGTAGKYYVDFWDMENALIDDIKERGVVVTYDNGGGQRGTKKNDSIDQRIKISAQMLKILDSLGVKPTGNYMGGDDDEL